MQKYILTFLVCLASNTFAATKGQIRQLPVEKNQAIAQKNSTTSPSNGSADVDQAKESNYSSSESLHKAQPTTAQKHSFLKHLFGYFGLIWLGILTMKISLHFFSKDYNYKDFKDIFEIAKWSSRAIIVLVSGFFISLGISFFTAYFYTRSDEPRKHSLLKHTLGFFAFCVEGCLTTLLSFYLVFDLELEAVGLFLPMFISSLFCAMSALINVYYFNKPHEEEGKQAKESKPSFWENFFGYFCLTWPGAFTMLNILGSLDLNYGEDFEFEYLLKVNAWDKVTIMIALSGLIISLGISFLSAYFYTKSHESRKHSLLKHTLGFFAFCVEGFLVTLLFLYLGEEDDRGTGLDDLFLALLLPAVISILFCATSALINVLYFETSRRGNKQATNTLNKAGSFKDHSYASL